MNRRLESRWCGSNGNCWVDGGSVEEGCRCGGGLCKDVRALRGDAMDWLVCQRAVSCEIEAVATCKGQGEVVALLSHSVHSCHS